MNNTYTGGPAFPLHSEVRPSMDTEWCGMTLRDWFAGMAMQGLIASPRGPINGQDATDKWYAEAAYMVADAMIQERSKE